MAALTAQQTFKAMQHVLAYAQFSGAIGSSECMQVFGNTLRGSGGNEAADRKRTHRPRAIWMVQEALQRVRPRVHREARLISWQLAALLAQAVDAHIEPCPEHSQLHGRVTRV